MTQRSPMNERNTSEEARTGVTRKSAASAKPKSAAAASVRIDTGKKTPAQKKAARKAEERKARERADAENYRYAKIPTQRYKNLRILWGVLLGVAILACVGIFIFNSTLGETNTTLFYVIIAISCIAIFGAFYVDFVLIKRERRRYAAEMGGSKSKSVRKAEKEAKQAELAAKKAAEEAPAAEETKKKKGFLSFFKK